MLNASTLTGMPVICMDEGKAAGYVTGLLIDGARRAAVCMLVDMGEWFMGTQALSFDRVIGIGDDAVMTGGLRELRPLSSDEKLATVARKGARIEGAKAYSPKGELLGVAKDFIIDASGQILSVELDNGYVIPQRALLAIGPDALIADNGRETTIVRMPPVEAEQEPETAAAVPPIPQTQQMQQTQQSPPARASQTVSLGNVTIRAGQAPASQAGVPLPRG